MHILQPKYYKLKQNEIQEILDRYNISKTQLPKIKREDSLIEEDGSLEVGDIIRIERKGDKDDKVIYYRVVV